MDDAIFTEVGANCRLDFDFTIVFSDGLIDLDGVAVINNIPLGHSLTFVCRMK